MAKRYARLNWQNSPSTATPVNATNLNTMDKGIDDCDNAIEDINNRMVQSDTINDSTKYPSAAVTYQHGQEIDAINEYNNLSGTYAGSITIPVVFGKNMSPTGVYTGLLPLPRSDAYTIALTSAVAQNVKVLDLSTITTIKTKLGVRLQCTDSSVAGNSVDMSFTLSK